MSPQTENEIGIQFGDSYWKLFKFVVNPVSKDAYLFIPIPDVALHLSIHSPKLPTYPNWHLHWRSEPLGIDEDVESNLFSPVDLQKWAMEWLEGFNYHEAASDEDVTVFPLFTDAQRMETLGRRNKTVLDFGRLIQTMSKGTFYRTKVRKLPLLMRKKPYGNISLCALSENGMILPIDTETMIEIDPHAFDMKRLMGCNVDSIFKPAERAIEVIQRTSPNSFQRWFPTSDFEGWIEETINPLKNSKPKIVDF